MKKYKLELSVTIFFLIFLVLLLWQTLFAINKLLPILLLSGCFAFFLFVILYPWDKNKKHKKNREVYAPKYFAKSVLSCIVGIAIIVGIAVILNKNNFSKTLDLTTNKINSLSDQTTKFLASLDKQVQIACVPSPQPDDNYCDTSVDLINLYAKNSKYVENLGTLNLANKELLQKIQPSGFSRLILISENNKNELDGQITENRLTNSLINLIKFKKTVYFLSGSGEPPLNAQDSPRSYSEIVSLLQTKSYEVKEWNIKQGNLPADAKVLVAGDNTITYSETAQRIITHFVELGGKLILIVNPYKTQGLNEFYALLNLKLDPILLTLNSKTPLGQQLAKQNFVRPPIVVSNFNQNSEITRVIAQLYSTQAVMPVDGGQPLSILPENPDSKVKTKATVLMSAYDAAPITLTNEQRNKIDLSKPFILTPDKSFDSSKAWPLAVDVEINGSYKSEVVVYGFSIVNPFSKSVPISTELIPLTVAHLYQDKEMVSIPARDFAPKTFNLSRNPGAWLPLFAGILPLLTAMAGFLIWMKRRAA